MRHNLPLVNVMNPDATINEHGGKYELMDRFHARQQIEKDLQQLGLLEEKRPYRHQIGHSYRSHVPVEPYLSDQWFVKTDDLAKAAADAVREGKVKFFPERYANTYLDWLANLRHWCISRQLWWGHRIPIWYCNNRDCYDPAQYRQCEAGSSEAERAQRRFFFTYADDRHTEPTCCPKCGGTDIEQDPDVLDTWFSSALWPHSTLGWPERTPELKQWYPTSVLITSRDIITLWVARMVMTGLFNLNEVPFRHVYIHAKILDGKGETMSKSKGNGVDPLDIIEKYGADAMRFSLAYLATEMQDIRMPVRKEKLPSGRQVNTSERFEVGRNFCNKLWNASRFALMNLQGGQVASLQFQQLPLEDRWILSRVQNVIAEVTDSLENYHFSDAAQAAYRFFWNELCDWYLEMVKPRIRAGGQGADQARQVLAWCLDQTLRLLHPMIPFETEAIWRRLNDQQPVRGIDRPSDQTGALVVASWPLANDCWRDSAAEMQMRDLQDLIRAVRDIRAKINRIRAANKQPSVAKLPEAFVRTDDQRRRLFEQYEALVCGLADAEKLTIGADISMSSGSACQILSQMQVYVPLSDLVDIKQERARLADQLAQLDRQIAKSQDRLENENFLSKAPPHVVEQHRRTLQELQSRRAGVEQSLAELPEE